MRMFVSSAISLAFLTPLASASTLIKADDFDCVSEVIPSSGLPSGMVTDRLETGVFVKTCEGDYRAVRLQNNEVSLVETNARIPSRALHGQIDGLNDSEISSSKSIKGAWLTGPTKRYRHDILGDEIEGSGLAVIDQNGKKYHYQLDANSVFEDRKVRIVDLDKDGTDELIVVRSYLNKGGSMAVFGIRGNALVLLDETKAIGIPNRWLNPAIVADVDGDDELEIAYVETPHIGGILYVLSLRKGKLVNKYQSMYTSNHGIGSRIQELAAAIDWNGDGVVEIAVPDLSRTAMKIISYAKRKPEELASVELGGRILSAMVAADLDRDNKPELYFALADGRFRVLKP